MSNLNLETNTISNAKFFYAKIKNASLKYQSQTEREYSVDVQVDKATAKAWNKAFPKQKAKEIEYDVFVEKFGAENAIGDEEQFLIKLKKDAQYTDKETGQLKKISDAYRPRAFQADENGNLTDITFTKLVGGGSKGTALFDITSNSFGTFAKFVGIRVDELVEVASNDASEKFKALGKVDTLADAPQDAAAEATKPVENTSENDGWE